MKIRLAVGEALEPGEAASTIVPNGGGLEQLGDTALIKSGSPER